MSDREIEFIESKTEKNGDIKGGVVIIEKRPNHQKSNSVSHPLPTQMATVNKKSPMKAASGNPMAEQ